MNKRAKKMSADGLARKRLVRSPLIPLVDAYWERGDLLKARGWNSFGPYWAFRQTLCSPEQWLTYQRYVIEDTKEALGNYRSAFLDELRADYEGDEILRALPCAFNFEELRKTPAYEEKWKPYRREQMLLRRREADKHASLSRSRQVEDEQHERIRIWTGVVAEIGKALGIEIGRKLSRSYSPIFLCPLVSGWSFAIGADVKALGFETADTVAKPPGMDPLPIGTNITWKALVPAGKSKLHPSDPDVIFIPQYFFPYDRAYSNFWDLEGLEINVRAEMTALQIIWPELKLRLIEGISKLE